jgi:hypothetical protein
MRYDDMEAWVVVAVVVLTVWRAFLGPRSTASWLPW